MKSIALLFYFIKGDLIGWNRLTNNLHAFKVNRPWIHSRPLKASEVPIRRNKSRAKEQKQRRRAYIAIGHNLYFT